MNATLNEKIATARTVAQACQEQVNRRNTVSTWGDPELDELWQDVLDCPEGKPMKRYAIVIGARSAEQLWAYMPDNYIVITAVSIDHEGQPVYVIGGIDNAGWTLDSYVIPRLESGMMWAKEIDLSHPIMKEIL